MLMEPIFGFILFFCACGIVAMVASKKGRSGTSFFFASAVPAVPLMIIVSAGLGNSYGKSQLPYLEPMIEQARGELDRLQWPVFIVSCRIRQALN